MREWDRSAERRPRRKRQKEVDRQKEFSSSVLFTWPFSVSRKASQKDSTVWPVLFPVRPAQFFFKILVHVISYLNDSKGPGSGGCRRPGKSRCLNLLHLGVLGQPVSPHILHVGIDVIDGAEVVGPGAQFAELCGVLLVLHVVADGQLPSFLKGFIPSLWPSAPPVM